MAENPIPDFVSKFFGPDEGNAPWHGQHQPPKSTSKKPVHYTKRDHQTVYVILSSPVPLSGNDPELGIPRFYEISNSRIGKALGLTTGAAAARVARLAHMKVIKPHYEMAAETGRVNRRVIELVQLPVQGDSKNAS